MTSITRALTAKLEKARQKIKNKINVMSNIGYCQATLQQIFYDIHPRRYFCVGLWLSFR